MPPPRIRVAGPGDFALVASLRTELAAHSGVQVTVPEAEVAGCLAAREHEALIADLDGETAGMATWSLFPSIMRAGSWAQLAELYVREWARRRGVARALLGEVCSRAGAAGATEVSVSTEPDNEQAKLLYRSLGFTRELVTLERRLAGGRAATPSENDVAGA